MIGQCEIFKWAESVKNNFPHFIVLVGEKGSGKRTLAKELSNELNLVYASCDTKVDTVREVIKSAYHAQVGVMYCFEDADSMRNEAKNAMLKITEEPPEHAYFCMTVTSDSSLLDTIKSRANVIHLTPYTNPELHSYATLKHVSDDDWELIKNIVTNCGQIDSLIEYNIKDFITYVRLVVDNICIVESSNAFKSSQQLQLKSNEGYDLQLFWRACILVWGETITDKWSCTAILCTSRYLSKVNRNGVNLQQLYDSWVFEIRWEYMQQWT